MFKLDLEKAEEPDINANIHWIIEKAREFQKNTYSCLIDYAKAFDSSSSLSAIRVVSAAYLRVLIFLRAILIPACVSSSPVVWVVPKEEMI